MSSVELCSPVNNHINLNSVDINDESFPQSEGDIPTDCLKTDLIEKPLENNIEGESKEVNHILENNIKDDYLDVLGNSQVLRKVTVPGLGRESRPTHGDKVTVEYEGYLHSGDEKDSNLGALVEEKQTVSFVLGDGDVIQALDLCTTMAEKHEHFEFITHPRFAYGEKGFAPKIPPNSFLLYRAKLLECGDSLSYNKMTDEERLEASNAKRERGNVLYRREDYTMAVNSYSKAIKILEAGSTDRNSLSKQNPDHFQQLLTILSNLAAAQLKIEAYSGALESSEFVLSHQPNNVKAIFRKGKSYMGLGEYSKALQCFREALDVEPDSAITKQELQRCVRLWQNERDQNARLYKRMIGQNQDEKETSLSKRSTASFWKNISKFAMPVIGVIVVGSSLLVGLYLTQSGSHLDAISAVPKASVNT